MKLEQLRYFVQIVECRSLNQAAQKLYMTQPALTASIHALEKELGVVLLKRSHKGAYPTVYGQQVYLDCKDILETLAQKMDTWKTFAQDQQKLTGTVYLAAIPALCNLILENIFFGIQKQYPQIDISLHEIPMLTFQSLLLYSPANIGLTSVLSHEIAQQEALRQYRSMGLNHQVLLADEYAICLSSQSPYVRKSVLTLDDLSKLDYFTYASYELPQNGANNLHREMIMQSIAYKNIYYLNAYGNILQAVADGQGFALFLKRALENNWYVKRGFICVKSLQDITLLSNEHHLLWADEKILSAAELAVLRYIQNNYVHTYVSQ